MDATAPGRHALARDVMPRTPEPDTDDLSSKLPPLGGDDDEGDHLSEDDADLIDSALLEEFDTDDASADDLDVGDHLAALPGETSDAEADAEMMGDSVALGDLVSPIDEADESDDSEPAQLDIADVALSRVPEESGAVDGDDGTFDAALEGVLAGSELPELAPDDGEDWGASDVALPSSDDDETELPSGRPLRSEPVEGVGAVRFIASSAGRLLVGDDALWVLDDVRVVHHSEVTLAGALPDGSRGWLALTPAGDIVAVARNGDITERTAGASAAALARCGECWVIVTRDGKRCVSADGGIEWTETGRALDVAGDGERAVSLGTDGVTVSDDGATWTMLASVAVRAGRLLAARDDAALIAHAGHAILVRDGTARTLPGSAGTSAGDIDPAGTVWLATWSDTQLRVNLIRVPDGGSPELVASAPARSTDPDEAERDRVVAVAADGAAVWTGSESGLVRWRE